MELSTDRLHLFFYSEGTVGLNNRVVVTGMGAITPLGLNVVSMWNALVAGQSGIDRITLFDPELFETQIAGEVKDFNPTDYMGPKDARHRDRFAQFAVAASIEAVENAKLELNEHNADQIGVVIGSGIGGLATLAAQIRVLDEKGPRRVNPFLIPMMMSDSASAHVSLTLKAKGPNFCTTSACSSSADAVGEAYELIKRGDAQVMITGGSEAAVNTVGVAAFCAAGALSARNDSPKEASSPFDAQRDGFVMSEGAGVMVLENLTFALKRGASILAEVIGYGATSDAYHITQPDVMGNGGAKAMQIALKKAKLCPSEIDYINAHGTSTLWNDKCETTAIKTVFGKHAYRIPVSSTKSMTGHLLGASGAIEAMVCMLAMQHGIIPPTINLEHPDPECDLDYVPLVARQSKIDTAMSSSFGFGGHNAVIVLRRYVEDGVN